MAKLTSRVTMPNATTVNDIVHIVDVSDTSQSPQGSSYKYPMSQLVDFLKKAGIGNWQLAAPTVNDDVTQGYINGAFWFDENAQVFYILNDNSVGAADWRPFSLQMAYDGGNVVNGVDFLFDSVNFRIGIGEDALSANTGLLVNGLGNESAMGNTGNSVNALGPLSAKNNTGEGVNALGGAAANSNTGNNVNAFGDSAGEANTASNSNFFGSFSGLLPNTTSHGVTVFSTNSIPSYADHAAALAALTVANGCILGQVYIYRNVATNAIGFVLPV